MKNSKTSRKDTFQYQLKNFKMLLNGSKMAKISSIILIALSLILAYISKENIGVVISLLTGAFGLVVYIVKFLSLKNIKQKSYTQTSLVTSLSKFKGYVSKRKKYEMYFMALWIITLIPFGPTVKFNYIAAIVAAVIYIGIVAVLGGLAFKKIDRQILTLESVMKNELLQQ
ncbi:hypothetical protein [Aquimarina rubra]|uniref:Uncharacterized protein n=1 Tax=Aquimarina rubra TaxID=1920033 RepID=A0ABW5LKQ5_9FLAO